MRFRPLALLASLLVVAAAPMVRAADKTTDGNDKSEKSDAKADDEAKTEKAGDEATTAPVGKPAEPARDPNDPNEDPGKTYYFIGLGYRQTLIPHFMFTPFVYGGPPNVWIQTPRIELTMRKDSFDTILHIGYSDFGMDSFGFRGKSESASAWEIVTSNLKTIDLGGDFLWSTDFNKMMSFQYGVTAALRIVFGDLHRVQGYVNPGENPDDAANVHACNSAGSPAIAAPGGAPYCGNDNNHYGDYTESSWVNGGSKPNLYASFGPQVAFRFKPVKQFMARAFVGWDIFLGPFFGLSANYGL